MRGKLLVIAGKESSALWSLAGATSYEYNESNIDRILELCNSDLSQYKAALIGEEVYQSNTKIVRSLNNQGLPWLVLTDKSRNKELGYKELQKLSEGAVGMRLSTN